jgi:hypothetical protein
MMDQLNVLHGLRSEDWEVRSAADDRRVQDVFRTQEPSAA